jgi:hypothetical protein
MVRMLPVSEALHCLALLACLGRRDTTHLSHAMTLHLHGLQGEGIPLS